MLTQRALLFALLFLPLASYADKIFSGRVSTIATEYIDSVTGTTSLIKLSASSDERLPLWNKTFIDHMKQGVVKLECDGYEPGFRLEANKDTLLFDNYDAKLTPKAYQMEAAHMYSSLVSFSSTDNSLFGFIKLGEPFNDDNNLCSYGLGDDYGFLWAFSLYLKTTEGTYAGCCRLTPSTSTKP